MEPASRATPTTRTERAHPVYAPAHTRIRILTLPPLSIAVFVPCDYPLRQRFFPLKNGAHDLMRSIRSLGKIQNEIKPKIRKISNEGEWGGRHIFQDAQSFCQVSPRRGRRGRGRRFVGTLQGRDLEARHKCQTDTHFIFARSVARSLWEGCVRLTCDRGKAKTLIF